MKPLITEMQKWSFDSEAEERSSHIFTEANLAFIRNCLADALLERAQLEYLSTNPNWTQQEAGLMGQIQAYRHILEVHEAEMNRLSTIDPRDVNESSSSF